MTEYQSSFEGLPSFLCRCSTNCLLRLQTVLTPISCQLVCAGSAAAAAAAAASRGSIILGRPASSSPPAVIFYLSPGHPDDGPAVCAVGIDNPANVGEALPLSARPPIARLQLSPPPDPDVRARAAARPWGGEPAAACEDGGDGRCRPALQCSASGRFVSATMPAGPAAGGVTRTVVAHLEVLSVDSAGAAARKGRLTPVWDGPGAAVAWHSSEDLCAILDPPLPSQPPAAAGKGKGWLPPAPSATAALTSPGGIGGVAVVLRSVCLDTVAATSAVDGGGAERRREAREAELQLRGDLAGVRADLPDRSTTRIGTKPV